MAGRPPKKSLDYFRFETGTFDDYRIMDLLNQYGPSGFTIWLAVITTVYRSGYYLEIPIDKLAIAIIKDIGNKWVKKDFVLQVILYCAEIGLLEKALLGRNVITSAGIQKRYSDVTARNKVDKQKYWLVDENGDRLINAPKNPISVTEMPIVAAEIPISVTETPIKEIKQNKIKEECTPCAALPDENRELLAYIDKRLHKTGTGIADDVRYCLEQGMARDVIRQAVDETADRGKDSWAYTRSILNRYVKDGIRGIEDLRPKAGGGKAPPPRKPSSYDLDEFDKRGFIIPEIGGGND